MDQQQQIILLGAAAVLVVLFVALKKSQKKPENPVALHPREYRKFQLTQRTDLNHNTAVFRFALPSPNHRVGLPVGKHLLLRFTSAEGKLVSRAYTPVSSDDDLGYFDLLIKMYPTGLMSQHLNKMKIGETIEARGPQGLLEYQGNSNFLIKRHDNRTNQDEEVEVKAKKIGMIAGGSGITPMLQIIKDIKKNQNNDKTELSLIFANVSEADILCRAEIDECVATMKNLKVYYTLDKPSDSWTGGKGFVTSDMISSHLPHPSDSTLILLCGPKPMMDFMVKNLHALDYKEEQYFLY